MYLALLPLQLEFAVQMTCQSCVDAVHKTLQGVTGKSRIKAFWDQPKGLCLALLPLYSERYLEKEKKLLRVTQRPRGRA